MLSKEEVFYMLYGINPVYIFLLHFNNVLNSKNGVSNNLKL